MIISSDSHLIKAAPKCIHEIEHSFIIKCQIDNFLDYINSIMNN